MVVATGPSKTRPGPARKRRPLPARLIENGWDAVTLLSADGTVLYASPATARVIGYTPEEFIGRNALEPIHPDDLPRIQEIFGRLMASPRQTFSGPFRYRHKDGGWRWLEGVGTNLLDEPGVRAIAANFRDVTRQRDDERLRSQLAAIVESSHDAIIGIDLDGGVVSWNGAAERLYGYAAAEMMGRPLSLLLPPGHADEMQALVERLRRGDVIDEYDTVRVRKDGTRIEVSLNLSPVRDAEGHIIGAAKITRDASARHKELRRQRILAESGAVLTASLDEQAILDSDPVGGPVPGGLLRHPRPAARTASCADHRRPRRSGQEELHARWPASTGPRPTPRAGQPRSDSDGPPRPRTRVLPPGRRAGRRMHPPARDPARP